MAARPSGKTAATERESGKSPVTTEIALAVRSLPRENHAIPSCSHGGHLNWRHIPMRGRQRVDGVDRSEEDLSEASCLSFPRSFCGFWFAVLFSISGFARVTGSKAAHLP